MGNGMEKALSLYFLGIENLDRGCCKDALSYLYQSFELQEHPKTAQMISQVLYNDGQDDEAFKYLERAYFIGSNNDNIAFCYAEQLIKQKKKDEARCILQVILIRNQTYKKARILLEKTKSD